MRKLNLFLIGLLLILGVLAGCEESDKDNAESTQGQEIAQENGSDDEVSAFPVTIEDDNGDEVTIEEEPEAIVSLMPSNTEIAFALGLDDQIVGVSDLDNYPEEALEKEKIGDVELNIEAILALEPDLVLAHPTNDPDGIEQLKDAEITVLTLQNATNFAEVYTTIEMVAAATGTEEKGADIIKTMQDDLQALEEKASEISEEDQREVFIEVSPEPEIFTPGNHTFENEILTKINAINIAAEEEGWVELNEETIIEQNPDIIFLSYDEMDEPVEQVLNRDGWQDIEAVKNEQVMTIDPDLMSRPGPRLIEGAETLAKAIYPDVFDD